MKKLKIGILTQPLHTNYGGLLQAYALQKVLKQMDFDSLIIDRVTKDKFFLRKLLSIIKNLFLKIIGKNNGPIRKWTTKKEKSIIRKHTDKFIKEHIKTTERIDSNKIDKIIKQYNFNAYIVGSDQVWRPKYSPNITNYFLDFINKDNNIIRISYAASFGVDYWEFNPNITNKIKKLIQKFDAISVREKSGLKLLEKHLNIHNAFHHIDPTLLLKKEEYIKIINEDKIIPSKKEGELLIYVLDKSKLTEVLINKITSELNLEPYKVGVENKYHEVGVKNIEKCIAPPVSSWLKGFMDAKYVITDSYHGTIFSILFNKPFISIANIDRGLTRFQSLLNKFNLEERLITSKNDISITLLRKKIDYSYVNNVIDKEREKSFEFLRNYLTNK